MGNYIWWARGPVRIARRDEPAALWRLKAAARGWERDGRGDLEAVEGASTLDEALHGVIWDVHRDPEGNIVALELPYDVKDTWLGKLEDSLEALEVAAPGSHVVLCNEGYGRTFLHATRTGGLTCSGCNRDYDDTDAHAALAAAHCALTLVEEALSKRPDAVPAEVRRRVAFGLAAIRAHIFERRAAHREEVSSSTPGE
jgi:hypothetical protein